MTITSKLKDIWSRLNSTCVHNRQISTGIFTRRPWGLLSRMRAYFCIGIAGVTTVTTLAQVFHFCGSWIICLLRAGWWKSNTPGHQSSLLGWPPAVLRDAALRLGASALLFLTMLCFTFGFFKGFQIVSMFIFCRDADVFEVVRGLKLGSALGAPWTLSWSGNTHTRQMVCPCVCVCVLEFILKTQVAYGLYYGLATDSVMKQHYARLWHAVV